MGFGMCLEHMASVLLGRRKTGYARFSGNFGGTGWTQAFIYSLIP